MSSNGDYPQGPRSAGTRRQICSNCPLLRGCLPARLNPDDVDRLDSIIRRPPTLARGESLYRAGDPFTGIHVVRAGAAKTYTRDGNGNPVTTGFFLPGEVVGLEAVGVGRYAEGARAVDTTSLCFVPFDRFLGLSAQMPALLERFLDIFSQELKSSRGLLRAFGRRTGRERVAALLLSLSERFATRGLSARQLHLPMTRADMADYLGLAPETLSRIISQFEAQGVLHASGNDFVLEDLSALHALVPDWRLLIRPTSPAG